MSARSRSFTLRTAALAAVFLATGCAAGGKLQRNTQVLKGEIEKARKSGALRCAPRELALAEANVEIAEEEIGYGHGGRAADHLKQAERSVKRALDLSKTCGPTQVTIKKPKEEPKRVVIEKTDADRDGISDLDDRCPELPGKLELQGCPDSDADGIADSEDACPREAGPRETQGCPVSKDSDQDGLPDDIDRCPLDAEDKDGFRDEDGCPDADNDNDGIVDRSDACPVTEGPLENRGCPVVDRDRDNDGVLDSADRCPTEFGAPPDGCPKKYTLVEVKKEKIEIRQQVHFANAKARVLKSSFPLLNQVVQVLRDYPKMRISIEGHTDAIGPEGGNMRLSQRRADAVRAYLVAKGIEASRLETAGYGPTRPIASNKTERGRAKNRRTEFRVIAVE